MAKKRKLQRVRLTKLRDHLASIKPSGRGAHADKFYMGHWGEMQPDLDDPIVNLEQKTVCNRCNTSACAMGEAAMMPEFRRLGLELVRGPDPEDFVFEPRYKGSLGMIAAMKFFGIGNKEAEYLFDPGTYGHYDIADIKPKDVVKRIDRILKGEPVVTADGDWA